MYFPPIVIMIMSILWVHCVNGHSSSIRPKSSFHWKTNSSDGQEIPASAGHWLGSPTKPISSACCLSTASPSLKRHYVTVGANKLLAFDPIEVDADIGDVVVFNFLALNHTLTQSSLIEPCINRGGFSTGFKQFNPKDRFGEFVVEYRVDTLDPQWFFCAQTSRVSHCKAGMVFALNARGRMSAFVSIATESSTSWSTKSIITAEGTMLKTDSPTTATNEPPVSSVSTKDHLNTIPTPTSQRSALASSPSQLNSSVGVSRAPAGLAVTPDQVLARALLQILFLVLPFIAL